MNMNCGDFLAEKKEEILEFVRARKKREGGFAATPKLPATVEDTYFAVRILELLSALERDILQGVQAFLKRNPLGFSVQPPVLRRWLWLAEKTGLSSSGEMRRLVKEIFLRKGRRLQTDIETLAASYECAEMVGIALDEIGIHRGISRTMRVRTMKELYLLTKIAREVLTEDRVSWILASHNPDGGFGFCPGTTSFLENTYFALRLLKLAGRRLPEPERMVWFVKSCYRGGGFARAPGGIPFLETTFYGVCLLKELLPKSA